MFSRLILLKPSHFRRFISLPSKQPHFPKSPINPYFTILPKPFSSSSNNNNNNKGNGNGNGNGNDNDPFDSGVWKGFGETEEKFDAFFEEDGESLDGMNEASQGGRPEKKEVEEEQWWMEEKGPDNEDDEDAIFKGIDTETEEKGSGDGQFGDHLGAGAENIDEPWNLKEETGDVFDFKEEDVVQEGEDLNLGVTGEPKQDVEKLQKEEEALKAAIKGPKRAFGDLIAASGITEEMLDSITALKDFQGIVGLPPLREIEDMRYEKYTKKSSRAEMERLKQEEIAKARVRQVDDKGRAYGTGRRKCSIARVWVQPGNGKFLVNEKEFDVYFPVLEHRATLLRPFSETKTLGRWDVTCTVKGGGVSGQVGAIRLGISKALQNWEPEFRQALRNVGFLTRDARVVERKKPGKAKARKSFQWVKR